MKSRKLKNVLFAIACVAGIAVLGACNRGVGCPTNLFIDLGLISFIG